jgi:hypothetical protein
MAGWWTPRGAVHLLFRRTTTRRTTRIALVVGTVLSLVNQGGVIFGGRATAATWIRVGANYVVPFISSSVGFLTATKKVHVPAEEGS